MTLANLLALQRLLAFNATPEGVQRLLAAAARNLADAQIVQLSPENRFDAAYKCILQCAMLGLWARGYRTSTSQPGHHQTALQALPLNAYEGDPASDGVVAECLTQARALLAHTQQFLKTQFPDLLLVPKK